MQSVTASPEWKRLAHLCREWQDVHLRDVVRDDPARAETLVFEAAGVLLDISRQRIDATVLDALLALARTRDVAGARDAMLRGDAINHTEARAALHAALRAGNGDGIGDAATEAFVRGERTRMRALVEELRSGRWRGASGERFAHVVHVGIGGSHLGPELAIDVLDAALPESDGVDVHFVSTTDPGPLRRLMRKLPRERTLIVLASKSFTTAETVLNGATLTDWLAEALGREAVLRQHVVGISANAAAMTAAGIPAEHQLHMPEWTGGRYSLWSCVGLPVALRFGMQAFEDLLDGARAMDRHFRSADLAENLPVLLALVGIWNINFHEAQSHAVLPYSEALRLLPAYLQQLEMESNGKRVDRDGRTVDYRTAPIIWGGVGMNGQHAFFQQLHQGTGWAPLDFILVGGPDHGMHAQRDCTLANGLAQAKALMLGRDAESARREDGDDGLLPYRVFPGNRPSTTLLLEELDARRLGALLALYEHKVFVQSVIWNLNPFDQFGVELGKRIAKSLEPVLSGRQSVDTVSEPIARQLLQRLRRND